MGKYKVLNVEDDMFKHAAISRALKARNCVIDLAKTGDEAMELIESNSYDFIVSDMQFPVQGKYNTEGGLWVMEHIKDRHIPIMFCSSANLVMENIPTVYYSDSNYNFANDLIKGMNELLKS